MTFPPASIAALGAMILLALPASAATLTGANFQVDYLFPDASSVYAPTNGPIFGVAGSAGADAVLNIEGVTDITLDFIGSALTVTLSTVLSNPTWNTTAFNGFRITFTDPGFAPVTGFTLVNSSIAPVTPTFTDTELFVNWAGASYVDGSTAQFSVAQVPLPAALPLLGAALAAVGAAGLRRRQKAALAA